MLYRCLASSGFQVAFINAIVEGSTLKCGLAYWSSGLSALPVRLRDADTEQIICKIVPPEELRDRPTAVWQHTPFDNLEFPILPL